MALTEEMLSRTRQARAAGVNERLTKPWRSRDIARRSRASRTARPEPGQTSEEISQFSRTKEHPRWLPLMTD